MHIFEMLGVSFVCITAMMTFLWLIYFFYRNAALIDIGKALSFIAIAIVYLVMGQGYWLRKVVMLFMLALWAGRLCFVLLSRLNRSTSNRRYQELTKHLRGGSLGVFYLIFLFQGLLCLVLSIPFLIVADNPIPSFGIWEGVGFAVWALALWGESTADQQLTRFQQNSLNLNQVLQEGLWKYSRHPNYFFEWCVWIGFALFATGSPMGWIGWIAPIIVLYMVLYVTGIPLLEAVAVESKGDVYRNYQRTTSIFLPWFPKK